MDSENEKPFCKGCQKHPVIDLLRFVDGQDVRMHFCKDCPLLRFIDLKQKLGFQDIVAALQEFRQVIQPADWPEGHCPNCGASYRETLESGLLGCSECYEAFAGAQLDLLQTRAQQKRLENGGLKTSTEQINRLERMVILKDELKQAIKIENYERAAVLRRIIHRMERDEKGSPS